MTRRLTVILPKHSGRDTTGRVSVRHQGGRHKRKLRLIDWKRDKKDMLGRIISIEYDPNRTANIALVQYPDGEKRYILAPTGLSVGDTVSSGVDVEIKPGNALPLANIPVGTMVHNVELTRGKGGQLARGAGLAAMVFAKEDAVPAGRQGFVQVKMPSGEIRKIHAYSRATVGQIGNVEHKSEVIGKAGRARHMGIRPSVRGVAMNPRSHPHGGGEGRSGIAMKRPKTYAGRPAVGKTRKKKRYSDKFIISRRKR